MGEWGAAANGARGAKGAIVFAAVTALKAVAAMTVLAAALAGTDAAGQVCGASRLGQPCPSGDTATQGAMAPALNLGAGNPLHLVTGNKYQREVDLPASATGVGLEIVRHYNAMDSRAGPLGRGWALSYDTRLYARAGRALVQIAQADGSRIDFHCTASCRTLPPGLGRLERADPARRQSAGAARDDGGDLPWHWRWHWPNGRVLDFDAHGWLTRVGDAGGDHVRIVRAPVPDAVIKKVVDQAGETLRFHYEAGPAGARLSRIDTRYGTYGYTHDVPSGAAAYRLAAVIHPAGWRREYAYEPALQSGDPYRLTGISWRIGPDTAPLRTHSWAYDARGRAVLSAHGPPESPRDRVEIAYAAEPSVDGAPGLTRVRAAGGTTEFHTAIRGGRPVLLRVEGAGCPGCAAPGLHADYDPHGKPTRLNHLHFDRDNDGRLLRLRDARSGWPGLLLSFDASRPRGPLTAWSSDATGEETRQRDDAGRVTERRYANGDIWRYAYDREGRPVEVVMRSAAGALRTVIAWQGRAPISVEHPHERETRRHDGQGRLTARTVHRPALQAGDTAYGYREAFRRDQHGRIIRHDLPEGGYLTYAYDAGGRINRIAWQDGGHVHELLRALASGGYGHGNGLRTLGVVRNDALDALAVDDPSAPDRPPILLQRLRYDAAGRIAGEHLRVADWHGAYAYAHDADGRLLAADATVRKGDHADMRDVQGMRHTWRHAWGSAGDALAMQDGGGTLPRRPRRDASGLPAVHGDLRLHYGPDRRLARVTRGRMNTADTAAQELARYTHNAYGERIRRRAGGRTEDYLYVANRLAAIAAPLRKGGVGVTRRFVYAGWVPIAMIVYPRPRALNSTARPRSTVDPTLVRAGGDARRVPGVAHSHGTHPGRTIRAGGRRDAPVFYAVHADAIGLPLAVTDDARRIRWRALWSPAGAAIAAEGDLAMPLRQPGHLHDPATGLHDNYLRTYDPRAGHYLEPDPAGPRPDTQVYGYADQQPRRYIDPHGLLLFAFDGTGRDLAERTNVGLMRDWYRDGAIFYHRGPGFASPRWVDSATGGSSPTILETQWAALLRQLSWNGHADIAIDLLGYSRGAALALHFSNMIADHHRNGRFWTHDPVLGTVTACVDLRFMGLFDTVAQFGVLGSRDGDYNLAAPAEWRWIAHAIALHERRAIFPLIVQAEGTGAGNGTAITAPFIGAHGDIGGGYLPRGADAETARPGGDLSDVALAWMLKQAGLAGAAFVPPPEAFQRVDNPIVHDERGRRARANNEDRVVRTAAGDRPLQRQGLHPDYGEATRAEVEAFIRRVDGWAHGGDSVVGTVDMAGYREWLRRTLDLDIAR